MGIPTMFRGTLRYPGWCATLKAVVDLGLLDETPTTYPAARPTRNSLRRSRRKAGTGDIRKAISAKLGIGFKDAILDRLAWLGLFSNEAIPNAGSETTALDVLAARMLAKMPYAPASAT